MGSIFALPINLPTPIMHLCGREPKLGRGGGGGVRPFNENYIQFSKILWSYYYYLIKFYIIKN